VVMLDRRKLAAPLFAQAAAFVAVLVIGGFTHHTSTPQATATGPHGATPAPTAPASATASGTASRGSGLKLTVKVTEDGTDGLPVSGSPVKVLQNGTLASVASGTLSPALEYATNVPAGQYQVCIDPPPGWGSAVRTTHVVQGMICTAADVRTAPALVTFRLTLQLSQVAP
jgi:hypothetical protein